MWDRGERATYMGKHLLMNTPIVRSILGMWLLTPEIKIPAETWISLWLRTDHKPGVTLTRCMWDARHLWTQLEGGSTGSAMMLKVHKHLQREVGRTCVLWEERWQNGGAGAFFFFPQFTFQHTPNTFEPGLSLSLSLAASKMFWN